MTSTTLPAENTNREATQARLQVDDEVTQPMRFADGSDAAPMQAEVISNHDLYIVTPPAYTQSIAEGEQTVNAEAVQEEKPQLHQRPFDRESLALTSPRAVSEHSDPPRPTTPLHILQERARGNIPLALTGPAPVLSHYLTEPAATFSLIGARSCSILHDRPAIWLVKKQKMALSPLAAVVLTKEGLIGAKDLELMSQHPSTRRFPTDPLSALLFSLTDTLSEICLGLIAGPIELGRQATPLLNSPSHPARNQNPNGITRPQAAGKVALEAGKGLGRVVSASIKMPVLAMSGVTSGFHNLPMGWGEEVREFENVTGWRSGVVVSAKSFGYGLGDGLSDIFAKPVEGAQKNGAVGFATGVAKGLGNAVCKPIAGACGLVGYPLVGIHKEIRNIKITDKDRCPADLVRKLGEAEYTNATESDKLYVVRVWCQTMMHVRLV